MFQNRNNLMDQSEGCYEQKNDFRKLIRLTKRDTYKYETDSCVHSQLAHYQAFH